MNPPILFAAILASLAVTSYGQGVDNTLLKGARGAQVVNAVVDRIRSRCIFAADRLFLRRAAYVTSRDGADPDTYRPGYDGGIWKIDEDKFNLTRNCSSSVLSSTCSAIQSEFGIEWTTVTWSDLRKPLYSGLAATLYTLIHLNGLAMPGGIASQASIWASMYGGQADDFSSVAAQATTVDCKDKLDLIFVLDGSGSVSQADFVTMKEFAKSVVDVMSVSEDEVHVALVEYSSGVRVQFDLDDLVSKANVTAAILATPKPGGGTNTALALSVATYILYNTTAGARTNVKKVAVLVTDGMSSSLLQTIRAGTALKDKGATVFSIGVGNYNEAEINGVASEPSCTHVFTLANFNQILQSILNEIQKSTCEASLVFEDEVEGDLPVNGTTEVTTETKSPSGTNTTLEAEVTCGILDLYVSTNDTRPGPAVYQYKYQALDDAPATLTVTETLADGTTLYITVVGQRLPASAAALRNCTDYKWSLGVAPKKQRNVTVTCTENGVIVDCTDDDISKAGLCDKEADLPVDNPCTPEVLAEDVMRHPYPYSPDSFIQCDAQGNFYVTSCPNGVTFNRVTRKCGFTSPDLEGESSGETEETVLPGGHPACSVQALQEERFYHAYAPDEEKFIQCDEWGYAWLMQCPQGERWSQSAYTCVYPSTTSSCTVGELLADPNDSSKFFQCGAGGNLASMSCPAGLVFKPAASVCGYP